MSQLADFLEFHTTTRPSLSARDRRRLFITHKGMCHICQEEIDAVREAWDIEHVLPWSLTRDNSDKNCMPAHERCHDVKTFSQDIPMIAKAVRQEAQYMGFKVSQNPMPGSKRSRFKKCMSGKVERRGLKNAQPRTPSDCAFYRIASFAQDYWRCGPF